MTTNWDTVFADQNTLLAPALTDYKNAYLNYLTCNEKTTGGADAPKNGCITTGSTITPESGDTTGSKWLSDADGNLNDAIQQMQGDLTYAQLSPPTGDNSKKINTSYNKMVNYRSQLDLKLQELYNNQNSLPNLHQAQIDSTVYAGILWTVLATSLLYYVFIKM